MTLLHASALRLSRLAAPLLAAVLLVAALGLALALEGLVFAAFPEAVRRAMLDAAETPRERMRLVGIVSAVIGVVIVWAVRRFGL